MTHRTHQPADRGKPRWRDVDPYAVRHAVAGLIPARKLTTDERRRAVEYLAKVERLSDAEIAQRLRWTGWDRPGRPATAVTKFRNRWCIPPAMPSGVNARYRKAVAA